MNLARMMTDKVFFEDRNGTRSGPYKTKFGTSRITVFQDELHVAAGDRVIQPLPDGSERIYIAEAVARADARRNIPAHFAITVAEESTLKTLETPAASAPRSANTMQDSMAALVQSLGDGIDSANFPPEQKDEARRLLRALLGHPVVAAVVGRG